MEWVYVQTHTHTHNHGSTHARTTHKRIDVGLKHVYSILMNHEYFATRLQSMLTSASRKCYKKIIYNHFWHIFVTANSPTLSQLNSTVIYHRIHLHNVYSGFKYPSILFSGNTSKIVWKRPIVLEDQCCRICNYWHALVIYLSL